jgi:glycosyltransferase involved in cell wall biosynthesis
MPSVAFVVPMYQSEMTIRSCLNSISRQTYKTFEVIVVDDGSTDNGPAIVEDAKAKDARIRLIRTPYNGGAARARNIALANTDADLVALLDADDEANPTRLERQIDLMTSFPNIGVCGSFAAHMGLSPGYDRTGRVPVHDQQIRAVLDAGHASPFYNPAVTLRRSLTMEVGGYREFFRYAHDYDLFLRLSRICSMHNIPEPLTRYRINVKGVSVRRMWHQRMFHHVAWASLQRPEEPLDHLWHEIVANQSSEDRIRFLRSSYSYLVDELIQLARVKEVRELLVRAGVDAGWPFASSLLLEQLRAGIRASLQRARNGTLWKRLGQ